MKVNVSPELTTASSWPLLSVTTTTTSFVALLSFVIPGTSPLSVTVYLYVPASVYVMSPKVTVPPSESGFFSSVLLLGIGALALAASVKVYLSLIPGAPVPSRIFSTEMFAFVGSGAYVFVKVTPLPSLKLATSCPLPLSSTTTVMFFVALLSLVMCATVPVSVTVYSYSPTEL